MMLQPINHFSEKRYKNAQAKAVFWIIVFILSVITSFILSAALLVLAIYVSFLIFSEIKINLLTIVISAGLCIMTALITYYNFKFFISFFKNFEQKGIEIHQKDYPELFALIYQIADEVGTKHPKKVLLDESINANVQYSNHVKSLFLPTRKNLTIGVGLLQMCSVEEFKGVLAHEFGHFSQKSMSIGSYAANVNRILYENLHHKQSIDDVIDDIAYVSGYIALITRGAIHYNEIFHKLYSKIHENLHFHYLTLSREMEFQADLIATKVVGIENMVRFFPRIEFYNFANRELQKFYLSKADEKEYSVNYYTNLNQVVNLFANELDIKSENGLIEPAINQIISNQEKLQIENIWSTHPTMNESIENICATQIHSKTTKSPLAKTLITNIEKFEQDFTVDYFIELGIVRKNIISEENFIQEFKAFQESTNYPKEYFRIFNETKIGYDEIIEDENLPTEKVNPTELFSKEYTSLFDIVHLNNNDIRTLNELKEQQQIKSFKYENTVYYLNDIDDLLAKIDEQQTKAVAEAIEHNKKINLFFSQNINDENRPFLTLGKTINEKIENFSEFNFKTRQNTEFLFVRSHEKVIQEGVKNICEANTIIKEYLSFILDYPALNQIFDTNAIEKIEYYIEETQIFYNEQYIDKSLSDFFENLAFIENALFEINFDNNKKFLNSFIPYFTTKKKQIIPT